MDCRIDRQRDWATRCAHEAACHDHNWFVTLTYAPEHLPANLSVSKEEHQRFMKRLRKNTGQEVRYFMCGEYGSQNQRPHYHYLLFGLDLADTIPWRRQGSPSGKFYQIYRSATLEKAWSKGHVELGEVNYKTAAYCAGYVRKKITGEALDEVDPETGLKPYQLYDSETGEVIDRCSEFAYMSRRPGIGVNFYAKYREQMARLGHCVIDGHRVPIPRFYLSRLAEDYPEAAARIRAANAERATERIAGDTLERTRQRQDHRRLVAERAMKEEL